MMTILENLTTLEFEAGIVASTPCLLRTLLARSPEVVELGKAYDSGEVSDDDIRAFVDGLLEKHPSPQAFPHGRALASLAVVFESRKGSLPEEYLLDLSRAYTARMRMASMVARECMMRRKDWSDSKNRRRCQLIDKEIDGIISEVELAELERLQREMLAHRRKIAPLPLDGIRKVHQELLQKANDHEEVVRKAVEEERKACAAMLDAEAQRIEELDDDEKQEIYDYGQDAYDDPFEVEASAYRCGAEMIRDRDKDEK